MRDSMTLEEQLQSMAGTASERQLIDRWLRRAPSRTSAQLEHSRAMIGDESAPEATPVDSQSPVPPPPSP